MQGRNRSRVEKERTLVLLVESTVATPPAEGVGLRVPLTMNRGVM